VKPVQQRRSKRQLYSDVEANRILERAMQIRDRNTQNRGFTRSDLEQMARELGITPAELQAAEEETLIDGPMQPERAAFIAHRRQQFKSHLISYALLFTFLFAMSSLFFKTPNLLIIPCLIAVVGGALWLMNEAYDVFLINAGDSFEARLNKWVDEREQRPLAPQQRKLLS
jgi:hypothetical protein